MTDDEIKRLRSWTHIHTDHCFGRYEPCGEHHMHDDTCGNRKQICGRSETKDLITLLDEVERLRKEDAEWSNLCNQQQALLEERYKLSSPQICGWCHLAAGDTEEARAAVAKYTLDEVREHTKTCANNPLVAEIERMRAQVESDAALVEALSASQTGYETLRAEADRMRPVYEAARAWRGHVNVAPYIRIDLGVEVNLAAAVDVALSKGSR